MKAEWIENYIYKNDKGIDVISDKKPADGRDYITAHGYIGRIEMEILNRMSQGPTIMLDKEYIEKQIKRLTEKEI